MKQFLFGALIMGWCISAGAQQDYFMFIQDVSRQPFYARLGDESHSSSASGHLILSSLKDSVYTVFVGFPGDRHPEQLFTVDMGGRDRGFELQEHAAGWQLFDLQALAVVRSATIGGREGRAIRKDDAYSRLMAGVVDDTTVLYTYEAPAATAAPKAEPAAAAPKPVPAVTSAPTTPATVSTVPLRPATTAAPSSAPAASVPTPPSSAPAASAPTPPSPAPAVSRPISESASTVTADREPVILMTTRAPSAPVLDSRDIIRYRTENQTGGRLFIYVDRSVAVPDTIRLIIPRL